VSIGQNGRYCYGQFEQYENLADHPSIKYNLIDVPYIQLFIAAIHEAFHQLLWILKLRS